MRYHVLFVGNDRPEPRHLAPLDADDDDHARRLLAEQWPGQDDLYLVRVDGLRLVRVPDRARRPEGDAAAGRGTADDGGATDCHHS